MLTPRTALLLTLLLAGDSLSQRARRPPQPPSPISTIPPKANFDAQQVQADRWVGRISPIWGPGPGSPSSPCALTWPAPSLQGRGSLWLWPPRAASCRSRATGLRPLYCVWLPSVQPWLSAPSRSCARAVDVVVGETDYEGFAILYLERKRRLSVKLYTRSLPPSDSALSAFEQHVQRANLTEDHVLFFPKYGFCEAADQFHVLDETRR
uniref:Lipocalin/cytosolic fatty-acid binding domain-containing protein n=1 Tax=Neovison vison TaxID=452646 RepID=A0A8C7B662_NEOVI